MKFSLFTPSRKRPALLKQCISSFFTKCSNPAEVEFHILMDYDDESCNDIQDYVSKSGWNITLSRRYRSQFLIRDYVNVLARTCSGKFIWGLNDECEVVTKEWDRVIEDNVPNFYDDR